MSNFRILFEWEDPAGVRGPELAATWARLEIQANGTPLTEFEDLRTKAIRSGVYLPLYPVAEWLAANWWHLWYEDRARQEPLSIAQHSFLAAQEGFALPDLRIWPAESRVLLECCPYVHAHAAVRFLNGLDFSLDREDVRDESIRLVEAVLEKLSEKQITRVFCEYAARLGVDPYALGPEVGGKIEDLLIRLPASVRQDFFDSAEPGNLSKQAEPPLGFLRSAEGQVLENVWKHIPGAAQCPASLPPWRQGYEYARFLRREMGLDGQEYANVAEILASLKIDCAKVQIGAWPTEQMDAVMGVSAHKAPVFALSGRRAETRNFVFCRALGEYLQSPEPQPLVLTRRSDSLRQKRSLRRRVHGSRGTNSRLPH
jgi:hypothetical protein